MTDSFDKFLYKLEGLNYEVDELVNQDREYFLEKRGEILEQVSQLIERIEDE